MRALAAEARNVNRDGFKGHSEEVSFQARNLKAIDPPRNR
jgi:hypothetical protein